MTGWEAPREAVRIRNATVASVGGGKVTLTLDGRSVGNVPVYGPMPVATAKVLVLEQGNSLLVLGRAVSLVSELEGLAARVAVLEGGGS